MTFKFIRPIPADRGFAITKDTNTLTIFNKGGATQTALVFVPGWTCPAGYYQNQVPFFETRYSVVLKDNQGVGGTPLKSDSKTYVPGNADDLAELLKMARFEVVHLVGHSMGAEIAVILASKYGKELNVRTVTLIAPVTQDPIDTLPQGIVGKISKKLAHDIRKQIEKDGGISETVCEKVRLFLQLAKIADSVRMLAKPEATRRTNLEFWRYALTQEMVSVATAMEGMRLAGSEVTERLASLEIPILIIGGKNDQLIDSEKLTRVFGLPAVKHGKLLEGVTHFPHIERPDSVNNLIESFIRRMEARV